MFFFRGIVAEKRDDAQNGEKSHKNIWDELFKKLMVKCGWNDF
jgi:hypothetical protein